MLCPSWVLHNPILLGTAMWLFVSGYIRAYPWLQEWYDERLRWDPRQIPLTDVVVEAKKLWRPEFASINGWVMLIEGKKHHPEWILHGKSFVLLLRIK